MPVERLPVTFGSDNGLPVLVRFRVFILSCFRDLLPTTMARAKTWGR